MSIGPLRGIKIIEFAGLGPTPFAAMTLAINVVMHDFWNVYEGLSQAHETQNFIKNLAIMAGLLVMGSSRALSPFSLDSKNAANSA